MKLFQKIKKVINISKIKFVILNDLSKLPTCINLNFFDEIYFSKATRNYLINKSEEKYKIGKIISNECK